MELRPYQRASIDALYTYFATHNGNPLIVLPTGTGKSVCIAKFCREAIESWPDTRILMVTHVAELITQNYLTLIKLWNEAPAGIYSAGLNKRDTQSQILFCGIQSVHKRAYEIQRCDLVLIDEAHLVGRTDTTMYRKFLDDLKTINPALKVIGYSATPYRLDTGLLHEGEGRLFTDIAYEEPVLRMVEQGYLSEVRSKKTNTMIDVSGVHTRGGDFIAGELERAAMAGDTTMLAVNELVLLGAERGSWLLFAAGIDHAVQIREAVRSHGIECEMVIGDTPKAERAAILSDFKRGTLRSIVNVGVLTTGFDAPGIDLIGMFNPTKSIGKYVQIVGRGTRLANGKADCLLLDFAGNVERHGPIDRVDARRKKKNGEGESQAPTKTCPECAEINHAAVRRCVACDHEFPPPKPLLAGRATNAPVLSSQIVPQWVVVDNITYRKHEKEGKPPSLQVTYHCGLIQHREWVCLQHTGFARQKAVSWWTRRSALPVPLTIDAADTATIRAPSAIQVSPVGKYTEIVGYKFD